MAPTIEQVRRACDRKSLLFQDPELSDAIRTAKSDLSEVYGISPILGENTDENPSIDRLHALVAANIVLRDYLSSVSGRAATSVSEQGSSINYVDLQVQFDKNEIEIKNRAFQLAGPHAEAFDV